MFLHLYMYKRTIRVRSVTHFRQHKPFFGQVTVDLFYVYVVMNVAQS